MTTATACSKCRGKGKVLIEVERLTRFSSRRKQIDCPFCAGTGKTHYVVIQPISVSPSPEVKS